MPNLPARHGSDKRRKTGNHLTRRRQASRLYSTSCKRWRSDRSIQLNKQPFCEHCLKAGRYKAAIDVDHINGRADREQDYTPSNYQSLCKSCHSIKTKSENLGG